MHVIADDDERRCLMQLTKFTHACVRLDDGDRSAGHRPGRVQRGRRGGRRRRGDPDHARAPRPHRRRQGAGRAGPRLAAAAVRAARRSPRRSPTSASRSSRSQSGAASSTPAGFAVRGLRRPARADPSGDPDDREPRLPRRRRGLPPRRLVHRARRAGVDPAAADRTRRGRRRPRSSTSRSRCARRACTRSTTAWSPTRTPASSRGTCGRIAGPHGVELPAPEPEGDRDA